MSSAYGREEYRKFETMESVRALQHHRRKSCKIYVYLRVFLTFKFFSSNENRWWLTRVIHYLFSENCMYAYDTRNVKTSWCNYYYFLLCAPWSRRRIICVPYTRATGWGLRAIVSYYYSRCISSHTDTQTQYFFF